jgi:hypothetical protein
MNAVIEILPRHTQGLRVKVVVNGVETVDDFLVDLPIIDARDGEHWYLHLEAVPTRAHLRRWEIRRSWLGRLLSIFRRRR